MKDTGRISKTLSEDLQDIIYGENSNYAIGCELQYVAKIDKAHILMLLKQKILSNENAKKLLSQIIELERNNFSDLKDKKTPRGIYFLYEDYLRNMIGDECGGMLQFGRSRNDLKATVLKIRLREPYILCINRMINLVELLLKKSTEYSNIVMPIYTHYQPAVPITYGHYLSAIAEEITNIIENLLKNKEIDKSPLGSGAVGGTTVNINTAYTAKILGFSETVNNSIVGVASRKVVQDLLSSLVEVESLISRSCEDYLLWTSSDLQFMKLPDNLVGGSSMMPNKRNAFLLENIRGRCSKALGAYVSTITAMKGEPFTNSIAVGTEAVGYLWDALKNIGEVLYIFENIIVNAKPDALKMLKKAKDGYTLATEYANCLTLEFGEDFRSAHKIIGGFVKDSIDNDVELEELIRKWITTKTGVDSVFKLDIQSTVQRMDYGWGPGNKSFNNIIKINLKRIEDMKEIRDSISDKWRSADAYLVQEMKNAMDIEV